MFKILRNRDYFMLWSGQTVSLMGDGIRDWALGYWVFTASGQSPVVQSATMIAALAPVLLLAPFSGVLVDRWDRRRIMIISDIIRFFLGLLMIPVVLSGQYWYAIVLIALSSSVGQFFDPARGAMIPRVVGQDQLLAATSLGQTTRTLLQLAGPALGTFIYLTLGPAVSVTLDAISFLVSAAAITLVRTSGAVAHSGNASPSFVSEFKAGLRYCLGTGPIRAIIIGFTVMFLGFGAVNTLNLFVLKELGIPISQAAPMATFQAGATLAVSLLIGSAASKLKRVPLLIPAGLALATLALGILAFAWAYWQLLLVAVLFGFGMGLTNIGVGVTFQSIVPDEMRGRVYGTVNPVPMGTMILGAIISGQLGQHFQAQVILGWSALLPLVAVIFLFGSLWRLRLGNEIAPSKVTA